MAFLKTSLVFTTPISWYGAFICFSFLTACMRETSWASRRCLLSFGRTRCLNYAPFPARRQYQTASGPHRGTNFSRLRGNSPMVTSFLLGTRHLAPGTELFHHRHGADGRAVGPFHR